ncbi:MAG: hypothetical protein J6C35_08105 [Bacteroidales bacterium]|nr:hypothetical protein [Bacteroidales bacterium]
MKRITINLIIAASFITSFVLSGCTEEKPAALPESNEEVTWRITASLEDSEPATRLDYFESGKALKAYWSEGDALTANPLPDRKGNAYTFTLAEGAGTATGIFECKSIPNGYLPENYGTNAWTVYYPGNLIKDDADYFAFSYSGQTQTGNGNLDHLEDYHTILLRCTDGSEASSTGFSTAFIDFTRDDIDESSCMKFNLSGLPQITPTEVSLEYSAPAGATSSCFHLYNHTKYWYAGSPNSSTSNKISIRLEDFEPCSEATVYMMMSNQPVYLQAGGTLTIHVKSKEGKLYSCSKTLKSDATLEGGRLHKISGSSWTESVVENIDGFDNPEEGIVVLQEATKGDGTDIIIMGDGFDKTHFGSAGDYDEIMRKAYNDFFSIEPYASLKEYFNVYYINAVSEEDHDAVPTGLNGAQQGDAKTVFNTEFKEGSTNITGNDNAVVAYAEQAIRVKGGKGGTECSANDVSSRANKALMIVMVNVECHAGTCDMVWTNGSDYCDGYSVAYTALHTDEEGRRWTMLHEAGGHGFGKLSDEYEQYQFTQFSTEVWNTLDTQHSCGIFRNVSKHWGQEERNAGWSFGATSFEDTDNSNVYWTELLTNGYGYTETEGLGIYVGANTYNLFFCRPTDNSIMRHEHSDDGHYFNAASRWAIWYRLMKLTGSTTATAFKNSLNEFIEFDSGIDIDIPTTRSTYVDEFTPSAPPVLIEGEWIDGELILKQ